MPISEKNLNLLKAEKAVETYQAHQKAKQDLKHKPGKNLRHRKLKRKLKTPGFGKPWDNDRVWFRVEFSWRDRTTEEEDNFQAAHWVSCRKFKGEERKFLLDYLRDRSQALSFSTELDNHIGAIWYFIHHYNNVIANS